MAHITNRMPGESIVLTLPDQQQIVITAEKPKGPGFVAVHIVAPQCVLISREEEPRTLEDRIREASL